MSVLRVRSVSLVHNTLHNIGEMLTLKKKNQFLQPNLHEHPELLLTPVTVWVWGSSMRLRRAPMRRRPGEEVGKGTIQYDLEINTQG